MTAAVVAEAAGPRTRCTTLRSEPPISLRETPDGLYLVASGAGPVGGDDLGLDLDVAPGASLVVRSAAAQLVLPGPVGAPSRLTIRARIVGSLMWAPEPTVLVAGCDHTTTVHLSLRGGASVVWSETIVLGRHRESSGSMLQRLIVDRDGSPLLRNEVAVGPRWRGSEGPAGTGGADVVTSTLVVGVSQPEVSARDRSAVLQLAADAWLVSAMSARGAGSPALRDRLSRSSPGCR